VRRKAFPIRFDIVSSSKLLDLVVKVDLLARTCSQRPATEAGLEKPRQSVAPKTPVQVPSALVWSCLVLGSTALSSPDDCHHMLVEGRGVLLVVQRGAT